jgi:putative addiction module killer protein
MFEVIITVSFDKWLKRLKDVSGKASILQRVRRIGMEGHFGDFKQLTDAVFELRITKGPGYRVYYLQQDRTVILLLGGTKSTQEKDIKKAIAIASEYKVQGI